MSFKKPHYFVTTWDPATNTFTPQRGVRTGPWSLWGLRKALRALQGMGYDIDREGGGVCVLVEREDCWLMRRKPSGVPAQGRMFT